MLWDLYGDMSGQVYRSWNTCVKLSWNLPRSTHNYLVEQLLAKDLPSVRKSLLFQYVSFLKRLGRSVSAEVRMMRCVAASNVQSVTGKNCLNIVNEFSLDPWTTPVNTFAKKYIMYEIPEQDTWRPSLLVSLIREKYDMSVAGEDTEAISGLMSLSAILETTSQSTCVS